MYKAGTIVRIYGTPYIISRVETRMGCAISLIDGNRWEDPIHLESSDCITAKEIKAMCGVPYRRKTKFIKKVMA